MNKCEKCEHSKLNCYTYDEFSSMCISCKFNPNKKLNFKVKQSSSKICSYCTHLSDAFSPECLDCLVLCNDNFIEKELSHDEIIDGLTNLIQSVTQDTKKVIEAAIEVIKEEDKK